MKVKIDKSFDKDSDMILDKSLKTKILNCILQIQSAKKIIDIKSIKKLKGSKNAYRIKLGDYRIGLTITDDTVTFVRFLHRKDVYKYFPIN